MTEEGTRSGIAKERAPRPDAWTKAARALFLDHLSATCNVSRSCLAAGKKNLAGVYRLRDREPAFAAAWDAALEQGYGRIEAELMCRALGNSGELDAAQVPDEPGEPGNPPTPGEPGNPSTPGEPARPFDPDLALKLLAQRAAKAAKVGRRQVYPRQPTRTEVLTALDKRLTAMEKRLRRTLDDAA